MKLYHYSSKRFPFIDTTKWKKQELGPKPHGLWLSDDDGDPENSWRSWCESGGFRLENLRYRYVGSLRSDANVLILRSAYEIDAFTHEYGKNPERLKGLDLQYYIDWPSFAQTYQGIVITPYCRSRRLDGNSSWYYGWDCASGCVWDMDVFDRFEFESKTATNANTGGISR